MAIAVPLSEYVFVRRCFGSPETLGINSEDVHVGPGLSLCFPPMLKSGEIIGSPLEEWK
jgi:hypothetical protein